MRILFMGTPDFAAASLKRIVKDGHTVCGVFTQPDKPKNRGMNLTQSPVKELAIQEGLPVYQPQKLRNEETYELIRSLRPEVIVVVAYGNFLPDVVLAIPPLGCINIHGSLLPKYRGAAPIQWAVLNGEKRTGVTSMYLVHEMDAGDMIATKETDVGEYETSGELFDRLGAIGAELLSETLRDIGAGLVHRTPQNHSEATFAPLLTKELCPISWEDTEDHIINKIRGLDPWPIASTSLCGTDFKIYKAQKCRENTGLPAGTVVSADKNGIKVACGGGSVLITELQAAGGRRMSAADYLRGHPLCP